MTDIAQWYTAIIEGKAPGQLKSMAAKGLISFPPQQMLQVLAVLAVDDDPAVGDLARLALTAFPRALLLEAAADRQTSPEVLDRLETVFSGEEDIISALAGNTSLPEACLRRLAGNPLANVLDVLARNQMVLRKDPDALFILIANPRLPAHLKGYLVEIRERQRAAPKAGIEEDHPREEIKTEPEFHEVVIKDFDHEDEKIPHPKRQEIQENRRQSIFQIIRGLSVPEKIVLAFKGNKEARSLLIRDSNKMVCTKVLESPRLSESEVEMYAKMTNVSDDILRAISMKKEWMGKYSIMKALATNAKTPIGISLPLVSRMSIRDLGNLGRNRNVPETVRQTASKLARMRREQRTGSSS
jgi:hypothetical protein